MMIATILLAAALAAFPQWGEPRRVTNGPHEHLLASYFAIDCSGKRMREIPAQIVDGRLRFLASVGAVRTQATMFYELVRKE